MYKYENPFWMMLQGEDEGAACVDKRECDRGTEGTTELATVYVSLRAYYYNVIDIVSCVT